MLNARNSNLAYNIFHKKFQSLVNKHAPLKYLSRKEAKLKQKPWLTRGILTSIRVKRSLLKDVKKTSEVNTFQRYKLYRNALNTLKKESKKIYYRHFFESNINNSKKTWSQINNILHRKSTN